MDDCGECSCRPLRGEWLTSTSADDLSKSLADDLFCGQWFLYLWLGISFVELVPVSDALSFNDVFDTSVVSDLSIV
jgi:hypothetical protein